MDPRTRYYSNLVLGIVVLVTRVADHIKGFPVSLVSGTITAFAVAVFFAGAIKAKREIPSHR